MRTTYTPLAAGGVHPEEVNMDSAIAAWKALKAGKDPYKAVNPWVRKKGKKGATPVQQEQPELERQRPSDGRRYFKAVCRLTNGNFDQCSLQDLVDIANLSTIQVQPFAEWQRATREVEDGNEN